MALFVCRVCVRYVAAADRAALPRLCPNCAHPAGFQEVALEAAAPPAAPDHGEPWECRAVIDAYTVHDRHGLRTVTGPRPVRDATGRLMSPVDWSAERDRIDRVVNCVNLLAGVPDAVLVGPRSPLEDLALTVLKASRNPEADGTALALFLDEAQATFSDRVAERLCPEIVDPGGRGGP